MAENVTWLTQEGFDKLTAELENLKGPIREEITARIAQARDEGDLKENGGYHAAREEQGKNEARIGQLEVLLRDAKVGAPSGAAGQVVPGMVVKVSMNGREIEFLLGTRELADTTDLQVYSEQSPLGAAINGAKQGDTVEFTAPNGNVMSVEIISARPFGS